MNGEYTGGGWIASRIYWYKRLIHLPSHDAILWTSIAEGWTLPESVRNNLNFKYKTVGTDDVDFWIVLYFWISCVVVAIFWTFLLRDPDIFFQMFLDKSSEHFRISVPVQRFPKMLPKKLLFISHILASMNSDVRCKGIGIMERLFTEFALVWGFFCMDTSHVSS